jgi:hypothetical protein
MNLFNKVKQCISGGFDKVKEYLVCGTYSEKPELKNGKFGDAESRFCNEGIDRLISRFHKPNLCEEYLSSALECAFTENVYEMKKYEKLALGATKKDISARLYEIERIGYRNPKPLDQVLNYFSSQREEKIMSGKVNLNSNFPSSTPAHPPLAYQFTK